MLRIFQFCKVHKLILILKIKKLEIWINFNNLTIFYLKLTNNKGKPQQKNLN
jgi:hypothetical protein